MGQKSVKGQHNAIGNCLRLADVWISHFDSDLTTDLNNFNPLYLTEWMEELKINQGEFELRYRITLTQENGQTIGAIYASYDACTSFWNNNFKDELSYLENGTVDEKTGFEAGSGG